MGGQIMLAFVVTPALREQDPALMRTAAMRTRVPYARAISVSTLGLSLAIFWFGVELAH